MIKAIFFDLDGTLLDSLEDIAESMNHVLETEGYPSHPIESYRQFVGNGMANLVHRALPEENPDLNHVQQLTQKMKEEFSVHWKVNSKLYPGIPDLLNQLKEKKITLGILSNKPHDFTIKTVEHFFSQWEFDFVQGWEPSKFPLKPDPKSLDAYRRNFSLQTNEILFLGDSDVDMITAKNAEVIGIGVSWGFRGKVELLQAGAELVIDQPSQLLDYLKSKRAD